VACDEVVDHFLRINNIVADHKMTFMERASLRSECRKLTRFLRLVDFVVIDTMRNLALDSVRETVSSGPNHTDRQAWIRTMGGRACLLQIIVVKAEVVYLFFAAAAGGICEPPWSTFTGNPI